MPDRLAHALDTHPARDGVRGLIWAATVLLGAISLALPLGPDDLGMARALSTVWATLLLLFVVYGLAPLRRLSARVWARWRAAWTGAWALFVIHCVVSIVGPLEGSATAIFDSPLVSAPVLNLVIMAWWTLDIARAWLRPDAREDDVPWRVQRTVFLVFLLIAFFVASVVQGSPTAKLLGLGLTLVAATAWLLRKTRRPALYAGAASAAAGLALLLAFPTSRAEVWSLSDCLDLALDGFRPVAEERAHRFLGKVQPHTARCRGGSEAVAYRSTPWVDWSNYWGTADSSSLALPWSPLGPLAPAGRGIDGALLDLEYERIELIQHNLFDNAGTFDDYVLGRDGTSGRALTEWPEMRLPATHPAYAAVGGEGPQRCSGAWIRARTVSGICNDLKNPAMGATGMPFARNVAFEETFVEASASELVRNRHGDRIGLLKPDPGVISRRLLARAQSDPERCGDGFGPDPASGDTVACDYQPAPFMNVLAAFWIQFMTHDWFAHPQEGRNDAQTQDLGCTDDASGCRPDDRFEAPLWHDTIAAGTVASANGREHLARAPRTTANHVTAWWDASQIYGHDSVSVRRVKRDPTDPARLAMRIPQGTGAQGLLPVLAADDPMVPEWSGQESTAFPDNWSVGLSFLHNVFAREHNLFVEAFRAEARRAPDADSGLRHPDRPDAPIRYRDVTDEELFQVARLVVSAEIAKIHTIEWTTQLLYNEPLYRAMNANWSGLLQTDWAARATEAVVRRFARSGDESEQTTWYSVFATGSGIFGLGNRRFELGGDEDFWDLSNPDDVGGGVNHFGSPFNFPEEFTSVYRLHPLVPDVLELRTPDSPDRIEGHLPVVRTFRGAATSATEQYGLARLGLSMGRQRLGALTLGNHPAFLQNLPMPVERTGTGQLDVVALDLIRDRQRGVPRFNEFRRQYGLRSLRSFDDFIDVRLPVDAPARRQQEEWAQALREVYGQHRCDDTKIVTDAQRLEDRLVTDCLGHPDGTMVDNVEDLDVVVGYLAESTRPHGFAISETQFVVFILNASRRLFSDRFFTSSFRPEFYSDLGVDWVTHNGPDGPVMEEGLPNGHTQAVLPFKRVLLRTVPALALELQQVVNAFDPWARARGGYYDLRWAPREGAEDDPAFRPR